MKDVRLVDVYKRQGIKYIFKEDGTYSYILKKRTVSSTYVFDDEAKTITMKNKLGIQTVEMCIRDSVGTD